MVEQTIQSQLNFFTILVITMSISSGWEERERVVRPANTQLNLIQAVLSIVLIVVKELLLTYKTILSLLAVIVVLALTKTWK
jgi:divalent metal cation (Fe/Co/Zn/Cd) transporter